MLPELPEMSAVSAWTGWALAVVLFALLQASRTRHREVARIIEELRALVEDETE